MPLEGAGSPALGAAVSIPRDAGEQIPKDLIPSLAAGAQPAPWHCPPTGIAQAEVGPSGWWGRCRGILGRRPSSP